MWKYSTTLISKKIILKLIATIFILCVLILHISSILTENAYFMNSSMGGLKLSINNNLSENPIILSDIPDPDIIRVGKDYYMVSTTMHMTPGVPIMHSTDLVNWRIIGYVYDRLEDNDAHNLKNGLNIYGKGQWATCIRYHKGKFLPL